MVYAGTSNMGTHDAASDHVIQNRDRASEIGPENLLPARDDEAGYSKGIKLEKNAVPCQESQVRDLQPRPQPADLNPPVEMADPEKADMSPMLSEEADSQPQTPLSSYARYRIFFHLGIWLFFTG
jgi:hypothetical protein